MLGGCLALVFLCVVVMALHAYNRKNAVLTYSLEVGQPLPSPETLFGNENAVWYSEMPDLRTPGTYTLDARIGWRRKTLSLTVADTTPPVIEGAADLTVYVGESVAYRKNIVLHDNGGDENVILSVDTRQVDISKAGDYPVTYRAVDQAGNAAEAQIILHVKVYNQTEVDLYEKIDRVLSEITTDDMTREGKLRAIHEYIQNHIAYVSTSDKSDWIAEAYHALFVSGQGDCFSYFSAAKAFLTRLDIPFYEIQRTPGYTPDTHYWMLVNINEVPGEEAWYHYDTTRLRTTYDHSGCLLTEKQAQAYGVLRPYFFLYDKTGLPEVATQIITPTPALEPYYR